MNEKAQTWLFCTLGGHFDHSVVLNRASNLKCTKQKKIWYQDWEIYLWRKYNFVSKMIIYGFGIYFHNMQKVTRRGKFSISVLVMARLYKQDSLDSHFGDQIKCIIQYDSYYMIHTLWFRQPWFDSQTADVTKVLTPSPRFIKWYHFSSHDRYHITDVLPVLNPCFFAFSSS